MSKLIKGKNDFQTLFPDLAKEWNYNRNSIAPDSITGGSGKKVWWICENGHEWESTVNNRKYAAGCPICTGRKVQIGVNDLLTTRPDLCEEWDYAANTILPTDVVSGSDKKVWWICKRCGNHWQAMISNRSKGSGCRNCSYEDRVLVTRKRRVSKKGSLVELYPEISQEWDYLKNNDRFPEDYTEKSTIKVWWKCKNCGHEWKSTIADRTSGCGCPKCVLRKRTSFPEQAFFFYISKIYSDAVNGYKYSEKGSEFDIFIPTLKIAIEYDGPWHDREGSVERDNKKYEYCKEHDIKLIRVYGGKKSSKAFSDCVIYCDFIHDKYNALDDSINQLFELLNITYEVDCDRDKNLIRKQYMGRLISNSLAEKKPNLCNEWNIERNANISPEMLSYGSHEKVWWICEKGHEWESTIKDRVRGNRCPFCSKRRPIPGENDLETLYPLIAAQWHPTKNEPLKPSNFGRGSMKEVMWLCKNGHEYKLSIKNQTIKGKCPFCK